jgi:UDP-N-acetyl-D-galactosamine dehydrogenase
MNSSADSTTIAVVGLGYVGLPLAVAFGRKFRTIGFDVSQERIAVLKQHNDPTGEVETADLEAATRLELYSSPEMLKQAEFVIIAVPTPVDEAHQPDFTPLIKASESIGEHLKKGAVVIYESTVYPGATEEICIPVLERVSGGKWKQDFWVGYSPERINPGDKDHTLWNVIKVVSGDTTETLDRVAALYSEVVQAGVHRASSIKVAEAAKVIENTQRDINIAFMNELAIIFDRMGIDTNEVLEAAGTKWNFIKFKPGLVGGHCIGVDPYYLTHKAEMLGYHPEVILAGRRINDNMGKFVAEKVVKTMVLAGVNISRAKVNILGLTFKENCADLRNSRVPDIIKELESYGIQVFVHDPIADKEEAKVEYGVSLNEIHELPVAEGVVVAVAHDEFQRAGYEMLKGMINSSTCIFDVKGIIDSEAFTNAGHRFWRL